MHGERMDPRSLVVWTKTLRMKLAISEGTPREWDGVLDIVWMDGCDMLRVDAANRSLSASTAMVDWMTQLTVRELGLYLTGIKSVRHILRVDTPEVVRKEGLVPGTLSLWIPHHNTIPSAAQFILARVFREYGGPLLRSRRPESAAAEAVPFVTMYGTKQATLDRCKSAVLVMASSNSSGTTPLRTARYSCQCVYQLNPAVGAGVSLRFVSTPVPAGVTREHHAGLI
jgi:hypothetical protein